MISSFNLFFFFNDTATTEIYTLPLPDALPIWGREHRGDRHRGDPRRPDPPGRIAHAGLVERHARCGPADPGGGGDRKSTRLNSRHGQISYAVFCLDKKNNSHTR